MKTTTFDRSWHCLGGRQGIFGFFVCNKCVFPLVSRFQHVELKKDALGATNSNIHDLLDADLRHTDSTSLEWLVVRANTEPRPAVQTLSLAPSEMKSVIHGVLTRSAPSRPLYKLAGGWSAPWLDLLLGGRVQKPHDSALPTTSSNPKPYFGPALALPHEQNRAPSPPPPSFLSFLPILVHGQYESQ